ncbi:RraA family protein [Alicyclobacillus fastidiosus]|uniref:Putative 4-hydroxy-4-methyl-2-oxoglutarate aldolase n=1 Tax=Alicyclobacillus fastidiosus TaxID=392011 RepID=A0ABV5A958_9BACL|nr:RraA family protein [Alicyclobacillus fastidiosus]WEH10751.1 RraA family protein [Alicyclobacillus fastidiosus]
MNADQRKAVLKLFEGLRVTDVNDGMDAVGLQNVGIMNRSIRPLWRDIEQFSHRIYGLALTVRFMPTNQAIHCDSLDEYKRVKQDWYRNLAPDKFAVKIQDGDIVVIDGSTDTDVGFCGSENTFGWVNRGARGVVTNGGARDTDEIIKQRLPVYCNYIGRGIRPGRLVYDTCNTTVNVGGVLVNPGDVIVADGDGVVCVPIDQAELVAAIARDIQRDDKVSRRKHYEKAGLDLDFTVE